MFLAFGFGLQAQNLLDLSDWTIGTGSAGVLAQNGSTNENTREWGIGPHGNRVILWKASPGSSSNADGGWNSSYLPIDHTKIYRFSVWIKKTNSNSGTTYFGPRVTGGDNALYYATSTSKTSNPYFFSSDLPSLNKWYLLVSYVQGSGDTNSSYLGEMYDGETGNVVRTLRSFKFQTTATQMIHRSYLYYDTNTSNRQYFYAPRMEVVNGNEPSIAELLGIRPTRPEELRVATDDLPDGYKLSVGGAAIAEKVKVTPEGQWPDYVFNDQYSLTQLDSLQKFIKAYQHLPGIPSARDIQNIGQDLGLIQQKLLEKIEELTLYTLEQENKIQVLTKSNSTLSDELENIRKQQKEILQLLRNNKNK